MLLRGTLILAGAALVARVLGVVQRIPLQRLLDDAGMSTYVTSYNVYMWLLVLATAGFPSAIAKLVSEKYAVGRPEEGEAIRRAANRYALVAGVGAAALVYVLAPALAALNKDPDAALAIRALAPALILFPWIAVERGYFHGRQRMGANGLSQIWEQILRVVTSIVLAYFLLELGYGLVWAAAGASFGGVLGAAAAAIVMLYYGVKLRREPAAARALAGGDGAVAVAAPPVPEAGLTADPARATADASSFRSIFRAILKLSIPVSVTALAVPTIYLIDSLATKPLLIAEYGDAIAQEMQGWLTSRAQSLAGIPVIFAIALSQSILPIISSAFVKRDTLEVERQTSLALRMTYVSGVPAVVVLATSAFSLNTFLFKDAEGSWVIVAMVGSVLFQVLMMISGSILLGIGRPELPMKHIAVGLIVKLALSLSLATLIGIYGVVAGTTLCFAVTMALNLRSLRKLIRYEAFGRRAAPFAATVALQAAIGAAVGWAAYTYVHPFGVSFWDAMLQTLLAAGVTGALYPVLLLRTGAFRADDAAGLPPKARKLWDRAAPLLRRLRLVR